MKHHLLQCCLAVVLTSCSDTTPPAPRKLAVGDVVTISSDVVLGCASQEIWGRLKFSRGTHFEAEMRQVLDAQECALMQRGPAVLVEQDAYGRLLKIRRTSEADAWWVIAASVDRGA